MGRLLYDVASWKPIINAVRAIDAVILDMSAICMSRRSVKKKVGTLQVHLIVPLLCKSSRQQSMRKPLSKQANSMAMIELVLGLAYLYPFC